MSDSASGHIAVTGEQWGSIQGTLLDLCAHFFAAPKHVEGFTSRDALQRLGEDVEILGLFQGVDGEAVSELRSVLARCSGDTVPNSETMHSHVEAQLRAAIVALCPNEAGLPRDPWKSALGVSRKYLEDDNGRFATARLLAAYYLRVKDFYTLSEPYAKLAGLATPVLTTEVAAVIAAVFESTNPLIVLRALALAQNRIGGAGTSARQTALEGAWEAHQDVQSFDSLDLGRRQMAKTNDGLELSRLEFDLYRQAAEGHLKPWLHWLLGYPTLQGNIRPTLGALRSALLRAHEPGLRAIARLIHSPWRNASAHEDIHFDDQDQLLDADGHVLILSDVSVVVGEILSFVAGCELALLAAAPTVDYVTRLTSFRGTSRQALTTKAMENLGDNGIAARDAMLKERQLTLFVDALSMNQVDPCFQSILLSKLQTDSFDQARVIVGNAGPAVVRVSNQSLEPTAKIWADVRTYAFTNPGGTFLAMNYETRTLVEDQPAALRAIAWLALNDAIRGYDDYEEAVYARTGADDPYDFRSDPAFRGQLLFGHKSLLRRFKTCRRALEAVKLIAVDAQSAEMDLVASVIEDRIVRFGAAIRNADRGVEYLVPPSDLLSIRSTIKSPAPMPTIDKSPLPPD